MRNAIFGAVREAWERGYQPTDVLRVAGPRLAAADVALLRSVLAAELTTYPPGTVDRRWLAQVSGSVGPEAVGPPVAWEIVARRAGVLLPLLRSLPRLERLGPLPGSRPMGDASPRGVDPRILERVRALLAKAESTTYPEEAETFTAGAQALMARHRIDAALVEARDERRSGPGGLRIGIDPPYESSKVSLLTSVAVANRCRTVWTRTLGFCTVVGFAVELDVVETLFTSLLVQATAAMTRQGPRVDAGGRSRTRAFRNAFLAAFAQRIGERLAEESAREEHEAATAPGGAGLLPVLAARDAEVEQALTDLFPRLRYSRAATVRDAEGWASGRAAADLADVAPQGRLASPP